MSRNVGQERSEIASRLLQRWEQLDIKTQAAPLLHFANEHPFITVFLGILAGLCFLPLLIFLTFVMMTFMFTFFGFLLVEGTLVSIATILLAITLFGVVCASFCITASLVLIWCGFAASNMGLQKLREIIKMQVPTISEFRLFHGEDNVHEHMQ